MKVLILAVAALSVLALASPASARHVRSHHLSFRHGGHATLGSGGAFGKGASGGRSTLSGGNPGGSVDHN